MKKNKFWIIIGVLFLVLAVLYGVFVSSEREKLSIQEEAKKRSIKDLEAVKERAKTGKLANDATRVAIGTGVIKIGQRITDIESYLKDSQKDFLYVKGEKDWKYLSESVIQYKSWYNKKRDDLFAVLQQSGFKFEKEGVEGELTASDYDHIKEKMGFRTWGSEAPTEKDTLIAQQQLALISVIIDAMANVFKDKKNTFPVFQKVSFEDWMENNPLNSNVVNSRATFKIDCPYAYINMVINELEKTKIHLRVDNMEVLKKANAKDYSEFPNVVVTLNLSFQIIKEKKVSQ